MARNAGRGRDKVARYGRSRVVFLSVPGKKPERQFKFGDRVTVSLSAGRGVDGVVRAVIDRTDGVRLHVDYGKDETALVYL